MILLKINGVTFKTPSKYKPSIYYIKEATRNSNGNLKQKVIAKKRKVECTWNYLKESEMQTLLQLCDNSGTDSVTLEYYDAEDKTTRTGTFYANDRTPEMFRFINDKAEYTNFSLNFIEF